MPTYLGRKVGSISSDETLERNQGTWAHHKEIKECHIVIGDSLNDLEEEIKATAGVPLMGALLRGAYCLKRVAKEIDQVIHPVSGTACGLWEVDCEYTTRIDAENAQNSGGDNSDPTNQRPKRRWRTDKVEEVLPYNADGTPIQTTAGEKITVPDEVPHPMLEISRLGHFPFDPNKIHKFVNKTNEQPFYGAPTGCALLDDIDTEEVELSNGNDTRLYVREVYIFKFRIVTMRIGFGAIEQDIILADGWDMEVPNVGYLYKPEVLHEGAPTGILGEPVTFVDANGQPQKIRLREDGSKAEVDDDDFYITVKRKHKANFSELNLEF